MQSSSLVDFFLLLVLFPSVICFSQYSSSRVLAPQVYNKNNNLPCRRCVEFPWHAPVSFFVHCVVAATNAAPRASCSSLSHAIALLLDFEYVLLCVLLDFEEVLLSLSCWILRKSFSLSLAGF